MQCREARGWSIAFGIVTACALIATASAVTPSASEERRVIELVQPARELAQKGKLTEALAAAEDARNKIQAEFGRADHWAAAYVLDDAARYRRAGGDFAGAYDYSRQAMQIAAKEFGRAPRFAYFAESAATLSYAAGQCQAALENATAAYDTYTAAGAPAADRERTALSLINLLIQRGSILDAVAVFERAFGSAGDAVNMNAFATRARLALAQGDAATATVWLDRADRALTQLGAEGAQWKPALVLLRSSVQVETGNVVDGERLIDQLLSDPEFAAKYRSQALQALQQKGLLLGFKGQYSDSITHYQRAFREYSREYSDDAPPMLVLSHNLGWVYRAMEDHSRAELQLTRTLTSADRCYGPANNLSLFVLFERLRLYADTGRLTQALLDAERAVQDADKLSAKAELLRAYALSSRALVLRRLGRPDDAYQDLLVAQDMIRRQRGQESWDLVPGYTELGELSLLRGDYPAAERWARAALAIRERDATRSMWANGLPVVQLMDVAAATNRWTEVNNRSEQLVQIVQGRLSGSQARSAALVGELQRSRELIERLLDRHTQMPADMLNQQNAVARLFQAMQLPHLTDLASVLRFSEQGDGPARQVLSQRRKLSEELESVRAQIDGASPRRGAIEPAAMQKLLRRSVEIETELTLVDAELRRRDPQLADVLRPALEPLGAVQALLASNEALYLQVVTENNTHGIVLRNDSVTVRSSQLNRSAVRRHVKRLRRALDLGLSPSQRLPFDYEAANALYAGTIGMFEQQLAGVSDLIVVLDDAFQNLPPAVLVADPSKSGQSGQATFLIERFGLTVEPSVGTFRTLRTRERQRLAANPFIGFGDPVFAGPTDRTERSAGAGTTAGGLADLATLPPLPETAEELKRIAAALAAPASSLYTGAAATEKNVKSLDLSEFQVVSFATHGLVAGEFRGLTQPALVLTPPARTSDRDDGLLTASEIAALKLKADLVILSACNTGRADDGGGAAGVSALARSFLFAGANSLLVSHWAVSSDATVELVSEAIKGMNSSSALSKAQALRHAALRLMRGEAGKEYRNPAYWAPFVLIGDGRSFRRDTGS
jgi:CHAT domain-containing protein/tetratricopeptide (TPR) repeat protein